MKFYYDIQVDYFKEMESYLKKLGCRVPVSGSNHWVNVAADVKSNSVLDYIDRHRYWDHPQFGYGTKVVFENQPMVKSPADALPNNFAFYRVAGKPFVISEWNCCFPNEYRVEGPIIMAAYADLQDWDGVIQFSFNNPDWTAPMQDNFDVSQWPNVWSQWQAAALIFHRRDIEKSKYSYKQTYGNSEIFGPIYEDSPIADEPLLPLISKTEIDFADYGKLPETSGFIKQFCQSDQKEINSDTRELYWNYNKGVFTIDTNLTQAAIGFLKDQSVKLMDVTFNCNTNFASLALTSLDGQPIRNSKRLLLTAASRIENTGQKYVETRTQLNEVGEKPILVEGVDTRIILFRSPKSVYSLDINGKRKNTIQSGGGSSFDIRSSDQAFFYEIVF